MKFYTIAVLLLLAACDHGSLERRDTRYPYSTRAEVELVEQLRTNFLNQSWNNVSPEVTRHINAATPVHRINGQSIRYNISIVQQGDREYLQYVYHQIRIYLNDKGIIVNIDPG